MHGNLNDGEREVSFSVGIATYQGRRPCNEDCCRAFPEEGFFAVADGIGGAPHGDVMAKVACSSSHEAWLEAGRLGLAGQARLRAAMSRADAACSELARWVGGGPGATLVVAAREGDCVHVASVGDCAAYRFRGGAAERVTRLGRASRSSRMLTGALGYARDPDPDIWTSRMSESDALLLCTDGVWGSASDEDLAEAVYEAMPDALSASLASVELSDGSDNASAIALIPQCA